MQSNLDKNMLMSQHDSLCRYKQSQQPWKYKKLTFINATFLQLSKLVFKMAKNNEAVETAIFFHSEIFK